jgi:tetratricopeptide (TPR) repeat protein
MSTITDDDDIPLMHSPEEIANSIVPQQKVRDAQWDSFEDAREYLSDDAEFDTDDGGMDENDPEEDRRHYEPDEEGRFHDDPLWWGKTMAEIRHCTNDAKEQGNKAHKEGDPKEANRHWKNALKGAQKLKDSETEFRLRLNLAMGYTKVGKINKALDHCNDALRDSLRCTVTPALQAKAHYRRAEALQAAGEIEKASMSFKSVLEIEPGNADARAKYAELKKVAMEQRKREKALFAGKSLLEAMSDSKCEHRGRSQSDAETEDDSDSHKDMGTTTEFAEEREVDEGDADAEAADVDISNITDRVQANELGQKILEGNPINYVGQRMDFFGPIRGPS